MVPELYDNDKRRKITFNKAYFAAFVGIFLTEVLIAMFVHDRFIRPYFGDFLAVLLIYSFIKTFLHKTSRRMPLYIFIFAVFVEFMQSINILQLLGLEKYKILRIIVGTSFSFGDILCYFAGMISILLWEYKKNH